MYPNRKKRRCLCCEKNTRPAFADDDSMHNPPLYRFCRQNGNCNCEKPEYPKDRFIQQQSGRGSEKRRDRND